MPAIKKRIGILRAILVAFGRKPGTIKYPFGPLELPENYRGGLLADGERCNGCGLCVRDCPANALRLDKRERGHYRLVHYPARCAYCGQCEESCRGGAIRHLHEMAGASEDGSDRVVVLVDKLE
jgi:hydrogenase-4 component H